MYHSTHFENIPRYQNKFDIIWSENSPKLEGFPISHVVEFLYYTHEVEVKHEDVQKKCLYIPYH